MPISLGLLDKIRFCAALLVAGLFTLAQPKAALRKVLASLRVWHSGFQDGGHVDQSLYLQRLTKGCGQCPLYFAPLKTCGTPLKKELRRLGCWCFMPYKATLTNAKCWIDEYAPESGTGHGWHAAGIPDADATNSQA